MEKELLCVNSDNQMIKDLSKVLTECGVEGADHYYEADDYNAPYFKLPKKYKKESDNDPDVCFVYVDIDENEYTVHGRYIHEHLGGEQQVANLVLGLLSGAIAEVALVFPDKKAGFFMMNTGDPEQNIKVIDINAETIMEHLNSPMAAAPNVHGHIMFEPAFPYYLHWGGGRQPQIQGVTVYMVSIVVGEHPEYYIIQ